MTGPRNRPTIVAAVMALLALSLAVITPTPVQAASDTNYANAWDSPDPVLWFPLPPASTNPLGPPDDVCVEGSSSPGNSVAFFEFPAFTVPGGSVITGIEVIPKYRTNDNHFIQLTNGGVEVGTERTLPLNFPGQSFCSSTSEVSIGGPGDLWGGAGLTDADFSAGTVGVKIRQNHGGGTAIPLRSSTSRETPAMPPVCTSVWTPSASP